MAWYAAHIILFFRLKKGTQKCFPIWENIVLIRAESEQEAFAKAEELGRQDAGDDEGSLRIDDKPAELVFAGIRKLVLCRDHDRRPTDGIEVSYTEMATRSEEAIHKLVAGEPVSVTIADIFPDQESMADATDGWHLARRCS